MVKLLSNSGSETKKKSSFKILTFKELHSSTELKKALPQSKPMMLSWIYYCSILDEIYPDALLRQYSI